MADDERFSSPLQYSTMSDSVYLWIKNAIIQGKYKPGEKLSQDALSRQLGVSRSPIRDAIHRLTTEGLLISKPHSGAVVFQMSVESVQEIYDTRILLEQYCAVRSCERVTPETYAKVEEANQSMKNCAYNSVKFMQGDRLFHSSLCEISKCYETLDLLEILWNKCETYKSIYYSSAGKAEDTIQEHEEILSCLRNKDTENIKAAIAKHLNDVIKYNRSMSTLDIADSSIT